MDNIASTDVAGRMDVRPVILERMPQQVGLLGAEDDWTGLTSSAERRKLQNRVNQRAYRRRCRLYGAKPHGTPSSQRGKCLKPPAECGPDRWIAHVKNDETGRGSQVSGDKMWRLFLHAAARPKVDFPKLAYLNKSCGLGPIESEQVISEFKEWATINFVMSSPRLDLLLVLIKFNVCRALMSNGIDLGFIAGEAIDDDDALSPFTNHSSPEANIPGLNPALQPTKLQREIPHHPWIDVLPDPGMRDNLLLAEDTYDDTELCADLVGYSSTAAARTGLIIWGEPWDLMAWEVTEDFLERWEWAIRGCNQLMQATNYWRKRRGEDPLHFRDALDMEAM